MNIFIVFDKFFGWIVAIWMRLVRLIVKKTKNKKTKKKKKKLKVLEGGLTTKIINIITKKYIFLDPKGPRPPPGSVPICRKHI